MLRPRTCHVVSPHGNADTKMLAVVLGVIWGQIQLSARYLSVVPIKACVTNCTPLSLVIYHQDAFIRWSLIFYDQAKLYRKYREEKSKPKNNTDKRFAHPIDKMRGAKRLRGRTKRKYRGEINEKRKCIQRWRRRGRGEGKTK